jgi:hypothetical protein
MIARNSSKSYHACVTETYWPSAVGGVEKADTVQSQ